MEVGPAEEEAAAVAVTTKLFASVTDITTYRPWILTPPTVVAIGKTISPPTLKPCLVSVTVTFDDPDVVVKDGTDPPFETPASPFDAAWIV